MWPGGTTKACRALPGGSGGEKQAWLQQDTLGSVLLLQSQEDTPPKAKKELENDRHAEINNFTKTPNKGTLKRAKGSDSPYFSELFPFVSLILSPRLVFIS